MIQGINREYIFNSNEQIKFYLRIINKSICDYKLTIMAYCIMNNHAHFFIYVEDITKLGKFMHKCNLQYTQIYNREKNSIGVLFRN